MTQTPETFGVGGTLLHPLGFVGFRSLHTIVEKGIALQLLTCFLLSMVDNNAEFYLTLIGWPKPRGDVKRTRSRG